MERKPIKRTRLILWEKEKGLKAKEIARRLGITEQTYCNIKNGKTTPSLDFAYKFSEEFLNEDDNVLDLLKMD